MNIKAFEIRDKATFIPVMAVSMTAADETERFLLLRAGYHNSFCVVLCRMECPGKDRNATYDPYAWGDRTFTAAHLYIVDHWHSLNSGDVIDVEFLLGETTTKKVSEREEHP